MTDGPIDVLPIGGASTDSVVRNTQKQTPWKKGAGNDVARRLRVPTADSFADRLDQHQHYEIQDGRKESTHEVNQPEDRPILVEEMRRESTQEVDQPDNRFLFTYQHQVDDPYEGLLSVLAFLATDVVAEKFDSGASRCMTGDADRPCTM